jgi:hypothetical protein
MVSQVLLKPLIANRAAGDFSSVFLGRQGVSLDPKTP